ncbi:Aromatic prenyltransferase, DMATS type [Ophiocordyceps camponoti-floridani]|uniref:Aromatic prenyltransferase, DMATS type n=1 Tax=Ophiocordyceps camponoti-floridani TaxID=2030778 RepID=A0A8H4QDI9_9HYPO|nr:Aromatic prenyltransferase, DMATS type [Ophiocordyceps camponoti-floridani]
MGPRPSIDGHLSCPSVYGDGIPLEYSWKWNTASTPPDVRYTLESIGPNSRTSLDPLNHDANIDFLEKVKRVEPSTDLSINQHFLNTLFDPDRTKYAFMSRSLHLTMAATIEFLRSGLFTKTYFQPPSLDVDNPSIAPMPVWEESLAKLQPKSPARQAMHDFLQTNPEGKLLRPITLALDNNAAASTRLKLYLTTPHTSFASVREILTLGGAKPTPDDMLEQVRSLISAVACLDGPLSDDEELPMTSQEHYTNGDVLRTAPGLTSGFVYYFDIGSEETTTPDVKLYILTRPYGKDDISIGRGLVDWMNRHGRGQYGKQYLDMLEAISPHRNPGKEKGQHIYVSCIINKDHLNITSYFVPRMPVRTGRKRGQGCSGHLES